MIPASSNAGYVGRLAPSPTGAQHLGNARTYLLAWLAARSQAGRLILRIEDIDSPRIKAGADRQAIDDLQWLGLHWDEGLDIGGPNAPYVQTQRAEHYARALAELQAAEQVYPCTCTRLDVEQAASAPHVGQEGPVYPGTCAKRRVADAADIDRPYCWRFRTTHRTRSFDDRFAGEQSMNVAEELGDFVVYKADGGPAYQLAVVVDDHAMGITEVVRGDDLIPSAFRQRALYGFFGWRAPSFTHVPLVVGEDGRRLAKRHGDTRLAMLREAGAPPQKVLGLLAWSCGWLPSPAPLDLGELLTCYDLATIPRAPFVFQAAYLRWLMAD